MPELPNIAAAARETGVTYDVALNILLASTNETADVTNSLGSNFLTARLKESGTAKAIAAAADDAAVPVKWRGINVNLPLADRLALQGLDLSLVHPSLRMSRLESARYNHARTQAAQADAQAVKLSKAKAATSNSVDVFAAPPNKELQGAARIADLDARRAAAQMVAERDRLEAALKRGGHSFNAQSHAETRVRELTAKINRLPVAHEHRR